MAIVVGVDGSARSRQALEWAIEEARLRGAGVVATMVYDVPPSLYPYGIPSSGNPEVAEDVRRGAETSLSNFVDNVWSVAEGVEIETEVVEDAQPARALTDRAGDGDILVVGSRGLGGFRGLLLGSVSQQVVQHARCPVVVVHPDKAAEPSS